MEYTHFLLEYLRYIILLDMAYLPSEIWKDLIFHPFSFIPIQCLTLTSRAHLLPWRHAACCGSPPVCPRFCCPSTECVPLSSPSAKYYRPQILATERNFPQFSRLTATSAHCKSTEACIHLQAQLFVRTSHTLTY